MMRNTGLWLALALALVGCQSSASTDTVESLVADSERLKQVQRQCRFDHANADAARCSAASEAYRRRFMGEGRVERTPKK